MAANNHTTQRKPGKTGVMPLVKCVCVGGCVCVCVCVCTVSVSPGLSPSPLFPCPLISIPVRWPLLLTLSSTANGGADGSLMMATRPCRAQHTHTHTHKHTHTHTHSL